MLLSDDINLRNKAIMANICASDSGNILKIIEEKMTDSENEFGNETLLSNTTNNGANTSTFNFAAGVASSTPDNSGVKMNFSLNIDTENANFQVNHEREKTRSESDNNSTINSEIMSSDVSTMSANYCQDVSQQVARICYPNSNVDEQLKSLNCVLGSILEEIMKGHYDKMWRDIVKRKPPWTVQDVLFCWKEHWIACLMDEFDSQVEKEIKNIQKVISNRNCNPSHLAGRIERLYTHIKKSEKYRSFIKNDENVSNFQKQRNELADLQSSLPSPVPEANHKVSFVNAASSAGVESFRNVLTATGNRMGALV